MLEFIYQARQHLLQKFIEDQMGVQLKHEQLLGWSWIRS